MLEDSKMCNKAVHRCFCVFYSIPDQHKTQEIYDSVVCLYPSLIVYCPDKYITQRMFDEPVDDSLAALKLIPDWFVTSKMFKKLYNGLYADENILYSNKDSSYVTFCFDEIGVLSVNLSDINLDNNLDEDDPDIIILIRPLLWHRKLKKLKALKKISEELMPIAWDPKGWFNFFILEDKQKEIEPIITE